MLTRRKTISIFTVLLCFCDFFLDTSNATNASHSLRLPTTVVPVRYHLHIDNHIHQDRLGYSGNVTIDVAIIQPTNEIVLHAKLLQDFVISLIDINNDYQYEGLDYSHDNQTDLLLIYSGTQTLHLQVGAPYRLEILFNGQIQTQHFGLYRTSYKDRNNITIPISTTQFEPTSARLAFPCFDEPSFKAPFIISITHGSNYSALSNMPVDGTPVPSFNGEMTTTTFRETPSMPTYLVAFVVSNYDHISENVNDVEHRVFFPPHSKDNGLKALKNSIKSVTALENYLGIKYPLPKLDHITVEKSYGSAMENWGLITYNKKNFLPTPEGSDRHSTLKLIIVQNHEIAHQWFGNLVSPKWWTYAWLNEGFATYFSYITTELVYPDWRVVEFFIDEVEVTYNWPINRAMTNYVEKEADIKSAFDVVIYQKAACFVKMFHHAIGHKTFIKGVALFLNKFKYSVADETDLFIVLQEAINEDEVHLFQGNQTIDGVMHTWTHNQGIPIVTVTRNYDEGTITIKQRSSAKNGNETWFIPLNFATASDPNFEKTTADYILPPQHNVTISLADINVKLSKDDWLIVNKQQTGLQHIVYDDHNLELIAETLKTDHKMIHMLNRALLFRDLGANIDKDLGEVEPVFEILQYLRSEEELMPWNTAADLILNICSNLHGSKASDLYKSFIRGIVGPIFHKVHNLTKSEMGAIDIYVRSKLIDVACKADLDVCLSYTKTMAEAYFFDDVEIDNALRDIILCQGIKYSTPDEFRKLVEKLSTTIPNSERFDDIIYSIRCVNRPENLKYFLNVVFTENSTTSIMSDFEFMQYLEFVYVSNYFSRRVVLEFMGENYKTLCKKSKVVLKALDRISNYVSDDNGQKEEFMALTTHVREILHESLKIEERMIGSRVWKRESFRKNYEEKIYNWLTNCKNLPAACNDHFNLALLHTAATISISIMLFLVILIVLLLLWLAILKFYRQKYQKITPTSQQQAISSPLNHKNNTLEYSNAKKPISIRCLINGEK